jgi:hypothetical protein
MRAVLEASSWLCRTLRVDIADAHFVVRYNGRTIGYETVWVNGERAKVTPSWLWFVPLFQFRIGSLPARVEVHVWPWLAFRSFHLIVEDEVLYGEGVRRGRSIRDDPFLPCDDDDRRDMRDDRIQTDPY